MIEIQTKIYLIVKVTEAPEWDDKEIMEAKYSKVEAHKRANEYQDKETSTAASIVYEVEETFIS